MKKLYSYAESTIEKMKELGLVRRKPPRYDKIHEAIYGDVRAGQEFDGRLPTVLKPLSMDQISSLLSLFSNWYGYLIQQYGLTAAERSEAKRQKETAWSMVRMSHLKAAKKYRMSVTDQKLSDMARSDGRFAAYCARYDELDTLYEMLEKTIEGAKMDKEVISREVTIRNIQIEAEARGRGFGNSPSRFSSEPVRSLQPGHQKRFSRNRDEDDGSGDDEDHEESEVIYDEGEADSTPRKIARRFDQKGQKRPVSRLIGKGPRRGPG